MHESLTISVHNLTPIANIVLTKSFVSIGRGPVIEQALTLIVPVIVTCLSIETCKARKMSVSHGYLLISILAVVSGAPRRNARSAVPTWYLPCGEVMETEAPSIQNLEEEVRASIGSLRLQHQLTMNDYLNRDYEYLYERVRIGVHEHQYIPNWVPGKKDVNMIKRLTNAKPQTIANHFPKLHMDLQKFAVAFEELVDDETSPKVYEALKATQSYLMMMLCEVESNIMALPSLRLPTRVERSIMSNTEREPADDTRRLVRDWGVLLKYRDYLHAWRHVFDY